MLKGKVIIIPSTIGLMKKILLYKNELLSRNIY